MTREEAITIIDNLHLIGCGRNQHEDDLRINIALGMAIKALSAEAEWTPCDTSDMPPEGEAVLMTDGKHIWIDETVAWWGDRSNWIGIAWMPLPELYEGGDTE